MSVTGQGLRPQASGPATSGITSQRQPVRRDAVPRVGHFSLQEHMATNRHSVQRSTGIRSDVQPDTLGGGAPSFGGTHFAAQTTGEIRPPYGFLPMEARDKFGPRINFPTAEPAPSEPEDSQPAPAEPTPSPRPAPPAGQILTMALPGTFFGNSNNSGTRRQKGRQNRYAPDLADPEYTPFVPRPTGAPSTPPDLPAQ